MAVITLGSFSVPSASAVMNAVRGFVTKPEAAAPAPQPAPTPDAREQVMSIDQRRYARLLDHELDRQLLTEVEREDSDLLARVRSALYADD